MNDREPVVCIDQLTKKYGDFTALDSLSLTLHRGEILGFIGPNGAGKTTTIKILVGQARPTSGRASILDADCTAESSRIKKLVGYMPDRFGAYDNMRVHEYLDFFAAAFSIPRRERIKRVTEVLETTGSEYMRDRFVESLSHGMQQRIGIAPTLLHDPQVLILDEPANGLDPQARIEMRELLLRLAAMGKTLIVTSHILPELSRVCDRVAILIRGKLRALGTLAEVMRAVEQERAFEILLASAEEVETASGKLAAALGEGGNVQASPAEASVRFRSRASDVKLADVLAQLVTNGVRVVQFREVASDLEETYLSLARQDRAEAAAEEASA
ncbi:MAG: ABC transporter ATP-binding protein [Planctomycetales bacterium]|nr:ABC transporter ATP-binding protein [Planctomycetales bacterium]